MSTYTEWCQDRYDRTVRVMAAQVNGMPLGHMVMNDGVALLYKTPYGKNKILQWPLVVSFDKWTDETRCVLVGGLNHGKELLYYAKAQNPTLSEKLKGLIIKRQVGEDLLPLIEDEKLPLEMGLKRALENGFQETSPAQSILDYRDTLKR